MPLRDGPVGAVLERAVRAGMFPGAVAVIHSTPDRLQTAVVGRSAIGRSPQQQAGEKCGLEAGSWFDLASLTKPLVVTTLMLLAHRERGVQLSATVGETVPETAGGPLASLTLHQLLTHTSGLPAWAPLYGTAAGNDREGVLAALLALQPTAEPGRHVIYSCPGFILLGLVLERVWGEELSASFARRVVAPLALADEIGFHPDPRRRKIVAGARAPRAEHDLVAERGLPPEVVPPGGEHLPDDGNARALGGVAGNAGLFGTATGVTNLALEYLQSTSRLLRPEEIVRATTCHTTGLEQSRGLGWQLAATPGCSAGPALSGQAFGHTGFTGCSLWIDPATQTVLVLASHCHHPTHRGVDLHPVRRRFHTLAMELLSRESHRR